MNYYNPYTGSKRRRTLRRVLLVLVSVLVIMGGTIIFGNYLKDKAAETEDNVNMGVGRDEIPGETESQLIIPPSEGGSGSSKSVKGRCVPLGLAGDFPTVDKDIPEGFAESEDGSFEKRLSAIEKNDTGVLINLTGEDGFLLYNSARAGESSRLPENPVLPGMEELSYAVELAKAKGLRTVALVKSGVTILGTEADIEGQIVADSRIAADAAEAGFDEVIISSLVNEAADITGETSRVILRYLNQMTAAAGDTAVGLSLPPDVYLTAKLSPQIELFTSRSVFLTMELTEANSTKDYMDFVCENLAGTLSVYNMRILFSPADTDIGKSIEDKLKNVEHENYLYTSVPVEVVRDPEPEETDNAEDKNEPAETK